VIHIGGVRKVEAKMRYSAFEGERLILADPTDPRICRHATEFDRIIAALTDSELFAVAMFCALGLVATAALCLMVPAFAEVVASVQAHP
jgi:hypothetical protein